MVRREIKDRWTQHCAFLLPPLHLRVISWLRLNGEEEISIQPSKDDTLTVNGCCYSWRDILWSRNKNTTHGNLSFLELNIPFQSSICSTRPFYRFLFNLSPLFVSFIVELPLSSTPLPFCSVFMWFSDSIWQNSDPINLGDCNGHLLVR